MRNDGNGESLGFSGTSDEPRTTYPKYDTKIGKKKEGGEATARTNRRASRTWFCVSSTSLRRCCR
eukprot:6001991-Pleurochrysis_carterae.AAC.1